MDQDRVAVCSASKLFFLSLEVIAFSFIAWCGVATAGVTPEVEYSKYVAKGNTIQPLRDTPFGEEISLYDGGLSFRQTDVEIPGIGPTIKLVRTFGVHQQNEIIETSGTAFYDWNIEIPRIKTITALHFGGYETDTRDWSVDSPNDVYARCTQIGPPRTLSYWGGSASSWFPSDWWNGYQLVDMDGRSEEVMAGSYYSASPFPAYASTKSKWLIGCLPSTANGQPGEGFIAIAPDGTRYWFNYLIYTQANGVDKYDAGLNRRYGAMLVTRVEDRFGNWLTYQYAGNALQSITASDGRYVSIAYTNGYVSSITAHSTDTPNRIWTYESANYTLTGVVNPDGSRWSYALSQLSHAPNMVGGGNCHDVANEPYMAISGSVTAPSGLIGTFALGLKKHSRSYVYKQCWADNPDLPPGNGYAWYPRSWYAYSLNSQTLTGPGLQPQTWSYAYSPMPESWEQDCPSSTACPSTFWVDVTDPKGVLQRNFFSNRFDDTESLLLRTEIYPAGSGAPIQTTANTYATAASGGQGAWQGLGNAIDFRKNTMSLGWVPLSKREIQQDGVNFVWQANTFDTLARPLSVTRSSTLGYSRTDVTAYYDDMSKWVLGQVASSTNSNTGLVESQTDYWLATALPQRTWSFGKAQQYFTYNANGTLATTTDGNNHTTSFTDWKRGIPGKITFADSTFKSAYINDNGWIKWVKDENGFQTNYGYDAMGRMNLIDYPDGDSVNWNDTTITFAPATATPYGLPNGHWRRTEATGTARKITYYDAMWRPMIGEVYDTANTWGTITQTITRYDAGGQVAYSSYPQRSADPAVYSTWANPAVAPNALGVWTSYDALGRPTQVQQNSELGLLTSTSQYLSGFQTLTTNPRGTQTVTQYRAYDQPSTDAPSGITVFAGADTSVTEIYRDIFGKPTQLKRRDDTGTLASSRYYVYDGYQQLCKMLEPETGATIMDYDAAGNLAWTAAGVSAPSTSSCNHTEAAASGRVVFRTYDARNRPNSLMFPNGVGNQEWLYWPDGQTKQITTYNSLSGTQVVNNYTYNKRRLLTGESQSQPDMPVWSLGYGYSINGALASITYPDGLSVAYAPNALGQPAQAGSYATGVSYFANGGMQQFTYGNGIVHTMIQNTRQLPDQSIDSGGVLNDSYDYDANGNVASISDGLIGAHGNRTMTYDGLDRLKTTTSPMYVGGAAYAYDALDNLTRVTAPGRDHYYCYDTNLSWRLTNVKTGGCGGATVIGLDYDEQGNLKNKNGTLYQFDYGNRLREVPGKESYRYDGYGRRVLARASQGDIYSFYGQDGALRYQRDERKGEAYDYISLNGSLVARVTDPNSVLGVPTLSAPASSSNGAYPVQWTAVASATRYEVEEAFNGGAWTTAYTGTGTSVALSGKASGSYAYRARACKNTPCGGWSATATVLVNQAPAAAPSIDVPAIAANGNYSAGWTAVNGATSYTLEESANGGVWTGAYTGANLSQAYSGKAAGSYAYRVKACNPSGCSGVSSTATTQALYIPGAPTVSVPASSYDGNYTVSWAAVSGATSYRLEESISGGAWALVQDAAATSKAYSGKADGNYSYRAQACNAAGCSGYSSTSAIQVLTPPTATPTVTAPANNYTGSYTVSWTGVAKATSYTLHVKVNGAVNGTNIYSGAGTSYNVSGQGEGSYAYYVLACNGAGCANWSAPATTQVQFIPAMPASLTGNIELIEGTRPPRFTVDVYWSASAGATYYELRRGTGTVYSGAATSWSNGPSTSNNDYTVRACSPGGCSAWKGPVNL